MTRPAVITHSPTLHAGQSRGLDQTPAGAGGEDQPADPWSAATDLAREAIQREP